MRGLLKSENSKFEISSSQQNFQSCIEEYQKWIAEEFSAFSLLNRSITQEVSSIMHKVNPMQIEYFKVVNNPHLYLSTLQEILEEKIK